MKKIELKRAALIVVALLTALMAAVMLAACGDSNNGESGNGGGPSNPNPAEFVGVYKFEYASHEVLSESGEVLYHQEIHIGDSDITVEGGIITEDYLTITLKADGTGIYKEAYFGNQNITWTAEGNTITVTLSGQSSYWTYDNGTLESKMELNTPGSHEEINISKQTTKLKKQ